MKYILDYDIAALILLIIIGMHFFYKKRFSSTQNHFFSAFFFIILADLILDIVTSYTISFFYAVAPWVNYALNTFFYLVRSVLPPLLFLYVLCLMGAFCKKHKAIIIGAMIPAAAQMLIVLFNLHTGWYFYLDESGAFFHGDYLVTMYLVCALYLFLSVAFLLKYKKRIRSAQFIAMLTFLSLIVASLIIQKIYPTLLVIGFSSSLSMLMMYLTLQNPSEMLDSLTGLFNRESFLLMMDSFQDRRGDFNLIVVDIDEMRTINDIFGVKVGDLVIKEVAKVIQKSTKSSKVFRITGDKFAIFIEDVTDCMCTIDRIKEQLLSPVVVEDISIEVSICICYSEDAERSRSSDNILPLIERSLFRAKKLGKNALMQVDNESLILLERENTIEQIVREAVANKKFEVYFQPIYDVRSEKFTKMEALARLNSDELGWISPQEFIPVAERTGLIVKLGAQIFDSVCEFIAKNNLKQHPYIKEISVNMSVVECLDPKFFARIKDAIQKNGIDPGLIILEITETAATLSDKLPVLMDKVKDTGICFSLDDFGMGYANIDSVLRLPFSEIKIDRSILVESDKNEKSLIVLRQMLSLSRELGLKTLVEGAETLQQVELINTLGADYIQGFYYSRPIPSELVLEFVDTKNA